MGALGERRVNKWEHLERGELINGSTRRDAS
jgi:hypothetical protein